MIELKVIRKSEKFVNAGGRIICLGKYSRFVVFGEWTHQKPFYFASFQPFNSFNLGFYC